MRSMERLRVGIGHVDITPPSPTPMEGYIERSGVSQGVHDRLFAKAAVLEDASGKKVAVISVDLIGVGKWIVDFARKGIESRIGIPRKNVMIAATHTHSGPRGVVDFFTGEDAFSKGLFSRALSEKVGNGIVEAVASADKNLEKAKIGLGRGKVTGLCSNRRSPDGPFDPELCVLKMESAEGGHSIGCIVNYACHPTVLGPDNLFFSADFPAYVRDTVQSTLRKKRREAEVEVLYLNGASGNVSTRFTRREATFAEAERIGDALGSEVLKVIKAVNKMNGEVEVSTTSEVIMLPQRKLPPLDFVKNDLRHGEEMLEQLKARGASGGETRVVESLIEGAKGLLGAYDYASKFEGREFEVEIQVFRLGEVVTLCAVPAELFVELGLEIKKDLKAMNPLIVGYANGFIGYVLTEEAHREGGYESLSTFLDASAGKRIIEVVEKLSKSLLIN
jgi:neutral ceramidase